MRQHRGRVDDGVQRGGDDVAACLKWDRSEDAGRNTTEAPEAGAPRLPLASQPAELCLQLAQTSLGSGAGFRLRGGARFGTWSWHAKQLSTSVSACGRT